jgi:hypothetical protein
MDRGSTHRDSVESSQRLSGQLQESILFESPVFVRRLIRLSARCEILSDALPDDGMEIQFVRWTAGEANEPASFNFSGDSTGMQSDSRMGTIFTGGPDGDKPALWSPRGLTVGRYDRHGRISIADGCEVESWWELSGSPTFHLDLKSTEDLSIFWPMVVFADNTGTRVSDLVDLEDIERKRYLKSDWFEASSVADLWKYFVDGAVFDPRDAGRGRFRCQQCADAWWSYLEALHRQTGKPHYRALARAVAWSVCADLDDDGAWRHGFWHEKPEIHARFFWDGVRLLLAENALRPDPRLRAAARRAADFALDHLAAPLGEDRLWLLHDSVEGSAPLKVTTPVLGRSPQNSLCLNTHVQALCVLERLCSDDDDGVRHRKARDRAWRALEALLAVRGSSVSSSILDRFLPIVVACKRPRGFFERVLRFAVYRLLTPIYWRIRKGIPGIVFPRGYLDRDLGATMLADEYHVINLKDLLEAYHLNERLWLRNVIEDAAAFVGTLDYRRALERSPIWAEWSDVLAAWNVGSDIVEIDRKEIDRIVLEMLDGHSLDALCHEVGLWPLLDADRLEDAS